MDNEADCQVSGKGHLPLQATQRHHRLEEGTTPPVLGGLFLKRIVFDGVFTLPDTYTDFSFTDSGTDSDTMGLKPNCIGVSVSVGMNTFTQFSTTHFLSVSASVSVLVSVNTP